MIKLIVKDFRMIKWWEYVFFIPAIILLSAVGSSTGMNSYVIGVIFLTVGLSLSASTRELMTNKGKLIHSLPVKRSEFLLAKYVSVIPWFVIASIFMTLLIGMPMIVLNGIELITVTSILFSFCGSLIGISLLHPVLFTYPKAAIISFTMFVVIVLNFGSVISSLFVWVDFATLLTKIISLIVLLIIVMLSYLLSLRLYTSKDLS